MTVYMNEDGATIEKIVTTMKKNNRITKYKIRVRKIQPLYLAT